MNRSAGLWMAIGLVIALAPATGAKSLWSAESPSNYLFTGANSSRVGDIITIQVEEDTRANDEANGEAKRDHTANGLFSIIFNNRFMNRVFGANNAPQLSFTSTNDFQGQSTVDRTSRFTSQIAATIVKIDPVGNFLIESRKTIRIGQEQKTIVLSGKIRPQDISVDNSVFSWQVADAEISYLGDGTLSRSANPTFFQRLFGWLF